MLDNSRGHGDPVEARSRCFALANLPPTAALLDGPEWSTGCNQYRLERAASRLALDGESGTGQAR
jgi:hypothetical protein